MDHAPNPTTLRAARWLFGAAGAYGLCATLPLYLRALGPATLFAWAFAGAAAATQLLYLLIARDPLRHRPAILVGIASKLSFAAPVLWLYARGATGGATLAFAVVDLVLAAGFAAAFIGLARGMPRDFRAGR